VAFGFVNASSGAVRFVEDGTGAAVVLLHQTPRSGDEYADVLPLLAAHARAIAVDTPGFGESDALAAPLTIEAAAGVIGEAIVALDAVPAIVVGHHTGGVIAVELAAARPELVRGLVLSSTPYTTAAFRDERARTGAPVDRRAEDPLVSLRRSREPHYPAGRDDLLERLLVDAKRAGPRVHEGHAAVAAYRMEDRIGLVHAPALVVAATDDPFSYGHARPLAAALGGAPVQEIEGGTVPLPDHLPEAFAAAVLRFVASIASTE